MTSSVNPSKPDPAEPEPERDIAELLQDGRRIEQAMRRGVRAALLRHKQLGQSIVVWRDGRIVELTAAEIPTDEVD